MNTECFNGELGIFSLILLKRISMTRHRIILLATSALLVMATSALMPAQEPFQQLSRPPVYAGSFYPSGRQDLESLLKELFSQARPVVLEGMIQSLIVPHAGYAYSGPVAASGYGSIPKDTRYKNIFIIASSHRATFKGASVYNLGNYRTPLGEAVVNRQIADALIRDNKGILFNKEAHEKEHSIEVQLPYIQYHFEEVPPIVPIVMGTSGVSSARDLAAALLPYFLPENLFVISSDFSHYPAYEDARRIDGLTGEAIMKNDPEFFYNTLRKNSNEPVPNLSTPSCGWSSILTLLYMSEKNPRMKISPILYLNSGDSPGGEKDRVVGYWALAGHLVPPKELQYSLGTGDREALLDISRKTLESYFSSGEIYNVPVSSISGILKQPAGAFVSLYMGGRLRGCIGNFSPSIPLYQVVQEMTLAAALRDQRFAPVESPELDYLQIEISVLTPLQKIGSVEEFELGRHGIYMTKNGKSGTFLPQVAQGKDWSPEEFLGHCSMEKAGLGWEGWKEADLYVYEAIVFGEEK